MAKFALNLVSAAAALAAANAAQADATQALSDAAAAQSDADTAITNAATADGKAVDAQTAVKTGAGVPLSIAPAAVTADGSSKVHDATISTALTPTSGHKYRVNGVCTVRVNDGGADDGEKVLTVNYNNLILAYTGTTWSLYASGDPTVESNGSDATPAGSLAGTLASWYATVDAYPQFGDGSGALSLFHTPENTRDVIIEFDGTIADIGVSTV